MTSIILAFSQPYFGAKKNSTEEVAIYIDNSYSMNGNNKKGRLLDIAKINATDLIKGFKHNTIFRLYTNNSSKKQSRKQSKTEIIENISRVENSSNQENINSIIDKITSDKKTTRIYIFSDFQKYTIDPQKLNQKTPTWLVHYKSTKINNLLIDSCWIKHPIKLKNQNSTLNVKITNNSEVDYKDLPINLLLYENGKYKLRAFSKTLLNAKSTSIVKLSYPNPDENYTLGKVEINDYPIVYDNDYYFSYLINDNIKILEISESSNRISYRQLYSIDSTFNYRRVIRSNFDFSNLNKYDLIITNGFSDFENVEISSFEKYVAKSGKLTIIPSNKIDINSYNRLFEKLKIRRIKSIKRNSQVNYINAKSQFYNGVFRKINNNFRFPKISQLYFSNGQKVMLNESILMKESGNSPVLASYKYKQGYSYFMSVDITDQAEELTNHPFLIPSMINTALVGNETSKIAHGTTKLRLLTLSTINNETPSAISINNIDDNLKHVPQFNSIDSKLRIHLTDIKLGHGNFVINNSKKRATSCFSINIDRKESEQKHYSMTELSDSNIKNRVVTNKVESITKTDDKNTNIWKILLLIALLFIGFESMILKFMK